jgi:cysteine desulfurase
VLYADNAATTKISDLAFEKTLLFLREQYGNASSQYTLMRYNRVIFLPAKLLPRHAALFASDQEQTLFLPEVLAT